MAATDELRDTFFQECADLLDCLGDGLTVMARLGADQDMENVHAVFRAVHSIKGGAGAFGLSGLVTFAHAFESVLDLMRSGRLQVSAPVMHTLQRAGDVLSDMVGLARDGGRVDVALADTLMVELDLLTEGGPAAGDDAPFEFQPVMLTFGTGTAPEAETGSDAATDNRGYEADRNAPADAADHARKSAPEHSATPGFRIAFAPTVAFYAAGHEPAALLRTLATLGVLVVHPNIAAVPSLATLALDTPHLHWTMDLRTYADLAEISAVFEFAGASAGLTITALDAQAAHPAPFDANCNDHPAHPAVVEHQPALFVPRPGTDTPGSGSQAMKADTGADLPPAEPGRVKAGADTFAVVSTSDVGAAIPADDTGVAKSVDNVAVMPPPATIRVNLDRVDRLINLIGEVVIAEAMLSQAISDAGLKDDGDMAISLDGIKQLAAEIQDCVMAIRAQPLKPVFQRMQRITREAADTTGKTVSLHTIGEATEVDKSVIERLVDPLTHMIRNAVDHGIEDAATRQAAGKPAEGVITLSAAHRSGRVMIEVSDDGGGIDRPRVRELAEARGLIAEGAALSPTEIDNLLFLPGFSSKAGVSALSGRGVGLDVVRKDVQALGGRVTIQSTPGKSTTFTILLPLTLAVQEGMLVGIGRETMVLPLSSIVETMRPTSAQFHAFGVTGQVISIRGDLVPVIDMGMCFGFPKLDLSDRSVLILVECESGRRAALVVDHVHDQRHVVIKSIADNYGTVPGISAATILGDGRIALIIDAEEIVQRFAGDGPVHASAVNG